VLPLKIGKMRSQSCNKGTDDTFTLFMGNKLTAVAAQIQSLQESLKDVQVRTNISEQKVLDLSSQLAQAEIDQNEAVISLESLKAKKILEEETYARLFQKYIDQIEWLKCSSRQENEDASLLHTNIVNSIELKIQDLKKQIESSQNEYVDSKKIAEELKKKISDTMQNTVKEVEVRKNTEKRASTTRAQLEDEMSRKITECQNENNKKLMESLAKFTELQNKYLTQSEIICAKEDIIELYENERTTITKIAKLGGSVVRDQTRFLFKGARSRSRSMVRSKAVPSASIRDLPEKAVKRSNLVKNE